MAADEQLALADRGATGGGFFQVVLGDYFKFLAGPNDGGDAAVGHKVGEAIGGDGTMFELINGMLKRVIWLLNLDLISTEIIVMLVLYLGKIVIPQIQIL